MPVDTALFKSTEKCDCHEDIYHYTSKNALEIIETMDEQIAGQKR